MELPAMVMLLTAVLFASGRTVDYHSSNSAAAHQRKWACSRTFWCCDRAPRGWQLFQLFFLWIILLVLCMPCLSAAATMEAQPCIRLSQGDNKVHNPCVGIDGSKDVEIDEVDSSKEGLSVTALGDGDVDSSRSPEAEMFDSSAQEDLLPALCMLPGWPHVQQAFLSMDLQTESSTEIIVQACPVQDQSVAAILDWGSTSLTSVSLKFLTFTNRQSNTELRVSRILTSNAQFCTVNFQEMVLSPGSKMSILIAYIPSFIGKAEGHMLLQTNTGGFSVKTLGEGVPSLIKIHPFSSFIVVSKAVWQETLSIFNPFAEPVFLEEAYVWVEPSMNQTSGEGVLCRRIDFMLKCSYRSRLKVRPIAEWVVPPYSSSPIMDLSIVLDGGEHLIGTLCLKIYRHSVQLSQVLVVPIEMEWLTVAMSSSTKPYGNNFFIEAEELEDQTEWAMFVGKSVYWQVQVREEPEERLKLGSAVRNKIGGRAWIGYSGKTLFTNRLCCSIVEADHVGEDKCLAKRIHCVESPKCFNMSCLPCKVSAVVKCFANACEPGIFHAHKSDCRHMPQEYYMGVLTIAAQCSNGSISRVSHQLLKVNTCLALLSPLDLAEGKNRGFELYSPGLFALFLEAGCSWPSFATESSTHFWAPCQLRDSSVSTVSDVWTDNDSKLDMGASEQHSQQERNSETSFTIQDRSFMELQKLMHGTLKQIESVDIDVCGSEYAGPFCDCKEPAKHLNLLEFDLLEKAVSGGCCEAHSSPLKSSSKDHSLPVCHASLSLSRHQKFVFKVALLILFSVFMVLVKFLRQEKLFMTDVRLRHSCSHTFFLHSVCLKTSYIKGAERSSNFEHTPERFNTMDRMECPDYPCYGNKFVNVLARVARSIGFILRWVFDSQATVLNVRVQIAESPCAASADQVPNYPRKSCLADDENCSMGRNCVEKPVSYQTSTPVQATRCVGCPDASKVKQFEANTSSPGVRSTTHCTCEDVLQRPSSTNLIVDFEQSHQLKEKKDKGKRKKKRNNIIDLKQESERMGQSGSSSPPSSPASPATYGSMSPFLRSDSPSRSVKGSRPRSNAFRDSTYRSSFIQFSSEMLSQLDFPGEHAHHSSTNKGTSQQLHKFGPKLTLEPLSMASVKTNSSGKGYVRKDSPNGTGTGENWASVARRAIATANEPDQRQRLTSSSRGFSKGGAQARPVLLPSATFPQSGRSMQWSPRMLEKRNFSLSDPMTGPSLVSTSLVAPHARAPGSRPAMSCNGRSSVNDYGGPTSQMDSTGICSVEERSRDNEYLYDIWGDHFAEFRRSTHTNTFSRDATPEHDTVGVALPASPSVENLFAASTRAPDSVDVEVSSSISRLSAGFSIFSRDAFFSPYQQKDTTTGLSTP